MATERTMMTPDGEILTFSVADETYLTPEGSIVNGDITAAAGGGGLTAGSLSLMGVGI